MIGITSFSKEGYSRYGKKFLESIDNWPGEIIAYLEEDIDFDHPKLIKKDLLSIPELKTFLNYIDGKPEPRGYVNGVYDYNFDLWKFCRKMFAQFDAFNEKGKVFWIDADCILKAPLPEKFLKNLFEGEALCFLGREGFYTECGFVGFDLNHPDFEEFKNRYIATLQRGIVFTLKGWHDCYCFDWARDGKGKNLTDDWRMGDPLHVFPNSVLGEYIVHNKGNRKDK